VRKGEALPAQQDPPTPASAAATLPHGTKETVAVTVRLDADRYHRLVAYGARFTPRRTNQDILVAALDAFLNRMP
jgi:hypothetical protein